MQRGHLKMVKLGLLGNSGVGKDTCVRCIQRHYPHLRLELIRLADPLYEVQNYIYRICGKIKDAQSQDGILLNFLGKHMRQINPDVLKQHFFHILEQSEFRADLVICSDVRPQDVPFVRQKGFHIVQIVADPELALERRKKRGDLSLGNPTHCTEKGGASDFYDTQVINNSSLQEFEEKIIKLTDQLLKLYR